MSEPIDLRRTPLWDAHRRLGARMVPFGGWEMPVQYPTGILAESRAVRTTAGLFDVSHMGRLELHGPGARDMLEGLTPNRVAGIEPGAGQYTLFLNEAGGILDDLIAFCQEPNRYPLIVNASNAVADHAWLRAHLAPGVALIDRTADTVLMALQGPLAAAIMGEAGAPEAAEIPRFGRAAVQLFGVPTWTMRTGYTGEDGFEIESAAESAPALWTGLLRVAGPERLTPCGLGARDVLRIEAGYPLYGHEVDAACNPWEAGLGWVLRKEAGFVGAEALARLKSAASRRLAGLMTETRSVARQGAAVLRGGALCGAVTSGTFSPILNASIALARVDDALETGAAVEVESGGRRQGAIVTEIPFVELARPRKRRASGPS